MPSLTLLPPPAPPAADESLVPTFRELTPEEVQRLEPDFTAHGGTIPSSATSTCVGMFLLGEMIGYQFLQLKLHAQPTKISPGYSHLFSALCRASEDLILRKGIAPAWVYVFAPEGELVKLAESRGLKREPWIVLSKLVELPRPTPMFVDVERAAPPEISEEEIRDYPGQDFSNLMPSEPSAEERVQ